MPETERWIQVAHQVASHRWPAVTIPLPPQRKIGENPRASSSLYWPGQETRDGIEYVLERGPEGQHRYWIGNAFVAQHASPQEIEKAVSECEQLVLQINHLTVLAQKSKDYQYLMDVVNALVIAGHVHPETIDELGEFKPLVAVCHVMRRIAEPEWNGDRVRKLVEDVLDGRVGYHIEATVTRENGKLGSVRIRVYPGLYMVFRFWAGEWGSLSNCWFGIQPNDNRWELRPIGETYRDQTWHVSHVCETPDQAVYLLEELGRIKQSLGLEEDQDG